jgi:hypothetical protein
VSERGSGGLGDEAGTAQGRAPKGDPVRRYLAARDEARAVQEEIRRMATVTKWVGAELEAFPDLFVFSDQPVKLPFEYPTSGRHECSAKSWPSVDAIMTCLEALHRTKRQVYAAWAKVPPEMRVSIHGPQDLYDGR